MDQHTATYLAKITGTFYDLFLLYDHPVLPRAGMGIKFTSGI
jgi:hypothetical protein